MNISQRAFDAIVAEEVTSQAYYTKHYQHPEWPGGSSGVTVGIGYDLGYATATKIRGDWIGRVDAVSLDTMVRCAGVRGEAAHALLADVQPKATVPWSAAIDVFSSRDVPSWIKAVVIAIPEAANLPPTCLGVLVGLAYNRGVSFGLAGDRYLEMRTIRSLVQMGALADVAGELRAMKRLWPKVKGLRDRREREAVLWETGLAAIKEPLAKNIRPAAQVTLPTAEPSPKRTAPPVTTPTQNTTAGAVVVAGAIVAQQAHAHGMMTGGNALFVCFLALLAGATAWLIWHRHRNPK